MKRLISIISFIMAFSAHADLFREYNFEGSVKLSNCSGSLIKFKESLPSSKAVILTNGHCYRHGPNRDLLKKNETIINESSSRPMQIYDKNMGLHPVKASKLLFASMTVTDVALYELDLTYQELYEDFNITPFELENNKPKSDAKIDLVSGFLDLGYSCSIDSFIFSLQENEWLFKDSIRFSKGCEIISGTSGSPLILKGTRKIIGINNTFNENGEKCTLNNPCEISKEGVVSAIKGQSYGQQTYILYSCLTADFKIDLSKAGCNLKIDVNWE